MKRLPWTHAVVIGFAVAVVIVLLVRRQGPALPPTHAVAFVPHSERPIEPSRVNPGATRKEEPIPPKTEPRPVRTLDRLLAALRSGRREEILAALDTLLAEIKPPPVPDEENAAVLYREAFAKIVTPVGGEEAAMEAISNGKADSPEQQALVRAYLGKNAEALRLLHEATKRPRCDFGLHYEEGIAMELPHLAKMIQAGKFLLRTEGFAREGEASQESWAAAHRMADALSEEPILVCQLVRNVCDGIASGTLEHALDGEGSDASLRSISERVDPEKSRSALRRSILGEMYFGVRTMMEGEAGGFNDGSLFRGARDPVWQHDSLYFAETLAQYYELMDKPYYETRERLETLEKTRIEGAPSYATFSKQLLPALERAARSQAAEEATLGTAKIAAAVKLYRSANGSYPASLGELRAALPVDPFTGKPYLYRREGAGFVVYSVGSDGMDSGGVREENDVLFRCGK